MASAKKRRHERRATRDEFAMVALNAMMGRGGFWMMEGEKRVDISSFDEYARAAYRVADQMLIARKP